MDWWDSVLPATRYPGDWKCPVLSAPQVRGASPLSPQGNMWTGGTQSFQPPGTQGTGSAQFFQPRRSGVPRLRLLPRYPVGLPRRVLPATGSGSNPKPAGFSGRVPGYSFNPGTRDQHAWQKPPETLQTHSKQSSATLAQWLLDTTHAATTAIHDEYLGQGTRVSV